MEPNEFAIKYFTKGKTVSQNELALREAITSGRVTPDMTLRDIAKVAGISEQPQLVMHYLTKFVKE
jgi:hypothetical protein